MAVLEAFERLKDVIECHALVEMSCGSLSFPDYPGS